MFGIRLPMLSIVIKSCEIPMPIPIHCLLLTSWSRVPRDPPTSRCSCICAYWLMVDRTDRYLYGRLAGFIILEHYNQRHYGLFNWMVQSFQLFETECRSFEKGIPIPFGNVPTNDQSSCSHTRDRKEIYWWNFSIVHTQSYMYFNILVISKITWGTFLPSTLAVSIFD